MRARCQQKFEHLFFDALLLPLSACINFAPQLDTHLCKHVPEVTLLRGVGAMRDARYLSRPRPIGVNLPHKRSCMMELIRGIMDRHRTRAYFTTMLRGLPIFGTKDCSFINALAVLAKGLVSTQRAQRNGVESFEERFVGLVSLTI